MLPVRMAIGGARTLGNALYLTSWNLIPIPLVKDIPMAAGYFLSRGTLSTYTMSYREHHSTVLEAGDKPRPGVGHSSANGICVYRHEGQAAAEAVSRTHGGERVYHAYAARHGFVQDIGESVLQKLGIRTNQVKVTEKAINLAVTDAGGAGNGGIVSADVHSRGGLDLANARSHLPNEVNRMLFIGTYGTACIARKGDSAYAMNYMNPKDYVPCLSDPFGWCKARFFGDSEVQFVPTKATGFDHDFMGDAYQNALQDSAEKFNEFLKEQR